MSKHIWFASWTFAACLLFLYSFTQVDLGLTLTRASFFQVVQQSFQYIGYFNRPLSAVLFLVLISLLFGLYIWTLELLKSKKINSRELWKVIVVITIILTFSYNAFSHDLFNYIFDAKIVTFYNQNPYEHKALDFPSDPMLGFMHWTHRSYPYGPAWLALTVPISYLGFGYFIITFFIFKILMAAGFLGSAYLIYRIAQKVKLENPQYVLGFFALSPYVLIESLVSAHNDIVMLFFAVLSLYYFIQKRVVLSFAALLFSIAIKFGTFVYLPMYLFIKKPFNQHNIAILFHMLLALSVLPIILASVRTNFQPWYFLYFAAFASFLIWKKYVLIPTIIFSIGSLIFYVPSLYFGNGVDAVATLQEIIILATTVISCTASLYLYIVNREKRV